MKSYDQLIIDRLAESLNSGLYPTFHTRLQNLLDLGLTTPLYEVVQEQDKLYNRDSKDLLTEDQAYEIVESKAVESFVISFGFWGDNIDKVLKHDVVGKKVSKYLDIFEFHMKGLDPDMYNFVDEACSALKKGQCRYININDDGVKITTFAYLESERTMVNTYSHFERLDRDSIQKELTIKNGVMSLTVCNGTFGKQVKDDNIYDFLNIVIEGKSHIPNYVFEPHHLIPNVKFAVGDFRL